MAGDIAQNWTAGLVAPDPDALLLLVSDGNKTELAGGVLLPAVCTYLRV